MDYSKNEILDIMPEKERVLEILGCKTGDVFYESVSSEYDTLFERVRNALKTERTISIENDTIYVLITAGEAIVKLSDELFNSGEGLAGLIVNTIADEVLFMADDITSSDIKRICAENNKGIKKRLEAPNDISLAENVVILKKAGISCVNITDGMMFSPVKTMGYELILTSDKSLFKAQHDCSVCKVKDCPRRVKNFREKFEIITAFDYNVKTSTGVAVDIGTTTVAAMRFENGKLIKSCSEINMQRRFGADVLSRIEAANHGRGKELKSAIEYQLIRCIKNVGGENDRVIVSSNTVMKSLLMGYDCSKLGVFPFEAQSLETEKTDMFGGLEIIGGISSFVGGDILSGLYMCDFDTSRDINLFVDLGTNGEMAIGNCDKIICTSTAAGPALEGGRISCGTGSVEGAISRVSLKTGTLKTIGDKKPCGICGTGITELVSELIEMGYVDKTGLFTNKYKDGYTVCDGVVFTQKDMREFQTAKSAVRAGIEILINSYGVNDKDIKNVYIAGGFGERLNIKKACVTGLLPKRFIGKYKAVGNSSLGGAVKLLDNEDGYMSLEKIKSVSEDFALAEKKEFTELFMKYMNFE